MKGRYLIFTPVKSAPRVFWEGRRFLRNWHVFVEICRSLHRDGLDYQVQFNLTGDNPHVLISASGTAKPRKQPAPRRSVLPPPVTAQRCRDRAREIELVLQKIAGRRNAQTLNWDRRQIRYQELSKLTAERLQAELEYWRELELLSGQRQHFKPGRTDQTACADDEAAA